MNEVVNVIGGGLAGVEAAWQAAEAGVKVRLYEMRPVLQTPAHRTDQARGDRLFELAEIGRAGLGTLSFKGRTATRAFAGDGGGGRRQSIPAGAALSVDRIKFAEIITERIERHPNIEIVREEITSLPMTASGTLALQSRSSRRAVDE